MESQDPSQPAARRSSPRIDVTRVLCALVGSTLIGLAGYVLVGMDFKPEFLQAMIAAGVGVICVRLVDTPGPRD